MHLHMCCFTTPHISKEGEREAVRGEGEGATVKSTVSSKKLSGHQSPCQSPRGLSGEYIGEGEREWKQYDPLH